jgi:hypothetical protein
VNIKPKKEDRKMGIINDILGTLFSGGNNNSSDSSSENEKVIYTSETKMNDEGSVKVREAAYIISNKETGEHSTIWSNTEYNGKTGDFKVSEGGHGEKYKK